MVINDIVTTLDETHTRVTLAPRGEMDAGTVDEFASSVQDALRVGAYEIEVDLSDVGFMDTEVLRVLEHARENQEATGGHLCLRNANPTLQRLLRLTAFEPGTC